MKSKLICAVLSFSVAFSSVAFAETSVQKDYNRTNNTIVISGTTDKEGYARLLVLNPGTDITNMTAAQIWAQTVYADEVSITSGGFTFESFSINPGTQESPTPEGTYIIRVASGNDIENITVDYASVERTIELLFSATDASTLSSYIAKYNDVYLFDVGTGSKYASFSDEGKTWVLNNICNDTNVTLANGLSSAQKAFTLYSSLWRISKEPWDSVRDVIDNYSTTIGLSTTEYSKLISTERDTLANTLSGNLYPDLPTFQTAVDNAAINIINNRPGGSNNSDNGEDEGGFNISLGGGSSGGGSMPKEPETKPEEEQDEVVISFADIENHWAEDSIILLASKGIVNGKEANNFDPEGYVTRAEAIKMLILAFGNVDEKALTDFSDVSADSWMYPYIATAANNGILKGYEDGTVGANNTVTRQDLCVMILRTARAFGIALENSGKAHSFNDAEAISDYAQEAVTTLWNNSIISGFDDGTFGPALGTTRAQISKMIAGFLK